jgi:Zn-dependent metalloprotease
MAFSQNKRLKDVASFKDGMNWMEVESKDRVSKNVLLTELEQSLDLRRQHSLEVMHSEEDDLGFVHTKYRQHYNNVPVEGAIYIFHEKNEQTIRANGRLVEDLSVSVIPKISKDEARQRALDYINARAWYWEDPAKEALIKRIKRDESASFYPQPELVLSDEQYSQDGSNYRLSWKVDIYAEGSIGRKIVFVDAISGVIYYTLEGCKEGHVEGIAETRYHGTQSIITDSVAPNLYRLVDSTRAGGIFTYDMNESRNVNDAVDFVDEDNYWDNANAEMDDAATDVHWGMEKTFDYFLEKLGRNSFDNNGAPIISYVHYNVGWFNARWTGQFCQFGDGGDNPLTSIDIVSHELTHGVTDYAADLIYANESGALNESFSDIFGTAVEFYALPDSAKWTMGLRNFALRNMANPNDYGHPDTYMGDNWFTEEGDNGGVHTNSGVQNYWFYLLSEGGSGMNDHGFSYDVTGIGMDKAAAIAYRNLTTYLTPTSTHDDARLGAILAAADLYGACSDEVVQTSHAWYAVGLGDDRLGPDLEILEVLGPVSACELGSDENLTFTFRYVGTGCPGFVAEGDTILLGFRTEDGAVHLDTMISNEVINRGDLITHTFSGSQDMSMDSTYRIDFWVDFKPDVLDFNDTLFDYSVSNVRRLGRGDVIGFERLQDVKDSIFIVTNEHAQTRIKFNSGSQGFWGFQMNGINVGDGRDLEIAETEADNFIVNPEYVARLCMCADATDWENVRLSFDLKQTFSEFHGQNSGPDISSFVSNLRIMVNDEQIGDQYHPETYKSDPYVTHIVDLDEFVGQQFELCFEGQHYLRKEEDPITGSQGDNSFLDNIYLTDELISSVEELAAGTFSIFPNPNNGQFVIQLMDGFNDSYNLRILDAMGRQVFYSSDDASEINRTISIDARDLSSGIYMINLNTDDGQLSKKILIK